MMVIILVSAGFLSMTSVISPLNATVCWLAAFPLITGLHSVWTSGLRTLTVTGFRERSSAWLTESINCTQNFKKRQTSHLLVASSPPAHLPYLDGSLNYILPFIPVGNDVDFIYCPAVCNNVHAKVACIIHIALIDCNTDCKVAVALTVD